MALEAAGIAGGPGACYTHRVPRTPLAALVYVALAALAVGWAALRGNLDLYHHPAPWLFLGFPASTGVAVALGLAVGVATIALTRLLVRTTGWARALHGDLREVLGPLTGAQIGALALASGVAEELFFRGAMQPALGIVLSSLAFGLVHVGPTRRYLPWTVWATVMGFVFAFLYRATGELAAPLVAHVLINYENLHFVVAFDPSPAAASDAATGELGKKPADPKLVLRARRPQHPG